MQLLIDGAAQRLRMDKVLGRILALEQHALRQQTGAEIGFIEIAGHLGRLLRAHRLHPVLGRLLRLVHGGLPHLLLHLVRVVNRRGNQSGGCHQQTATGDQGNPTLDRKSAHANIPTSYRYG